MSSPIATSEAATARRICEDFDERLVERARGAEAHQAPFCYFCDEMIAVESLVCTHCHKVLQDD